ncbi:MAG TPA: cohesin domain-containing protein [Saprospiraceae bacterium]|nr:cohesin domain-containing protein [Saprospiraceae bacterium]
MNRKIAPFLLFLWLTPCFSFAFPNLQADSTLYLSIPEIKANQGDTISVPLTVANFNQITALSFSLRWRETWEPVQQIELHPDLEAADIRDNGSGIDLNWSDTKPLDLPDSTVILRLSYVVNYRGLGVLDFMDAPSPIRASSQGVELPVATQNGFIFVDLFDKVGITAGGGMISQGEEICIPVSVYNFQDILAMQFQLRWDTSIFSFVEVKPLELGISDRSLGLTETNTRGRMRLSWFDQTLTGQSLDDSTAIFELCLRAKKATDSTFVELDESNFFVEIINTDELLVGHTYSRSAIEVLQLVWPGDTDANGTVNHFDLFNIGLAYGEEGPPRPAASLNWEGQLSYLWEKKTPGANLDFRFADANGDGQVNEVDVSAIRQNWNRESTPSESGAQAPALRGEGVPLFLDVDTLLEGNQTIIPIHLGTATQPSTPVYSIGFSIIYPAGLILPDSVTLSLDDSWLAEGQDTLLQILQQDASAGRIDLAISRTDGQALAGFGVIGYLSLTVGEGLPETTASDPYIFEMMEVRIIDAQEREALVAPEPSEVVLNVVSQTQNMLPDYLLEVYPVPTTDLLQLALPADIEVDYIQLFDMSGRLRKLVSRPGHQFTWSIGALPTGTYLLKVQTEQGVLRRLIMKK